MITIKESGTEPKQILKGFAGAAEKAETRLQCERCGTRIFSGNES